MVHDADAPARQSILHKATPTDGGLISRAASDDKPLTFVISTEQPDLVGDVVMQAGLKPVSPRIPAQLDHSGEMANVIGSWGNFVVRAGKTFADLKLLPTGISRMADLVRAMADAGVRLAASIGFKPDWSQTDDIKDKDGRITGFRFNAATLLEVSVVVVPAQPDALQVRSLLTQERDRATLDQLVAQRRRGLASPATRGVGQSAPPLPVLLRRADATRSPIMGKKLSDQITEATTELNTLRDDQTATVEKLGESADTTEQTALEAHAAELTTQIIAKANRLQVLKDAEDSLKPRIAALHQGGDGGDDDEDDNDGDVQRSGALQSRNAAGNLQRQRSAESRRVHSLRKRPDTPDGMNVVRAGLCVFQAYVQRIPLEQVLEQRYGGNELVSIVTKATQNPAMTTVPAWAGELVRETFGAFMDLLAPESVVPNIPMARYDFGNNGIIKIPRRNSGYPASPNLAAAFRAEGAPIRVGAISLASSNLTPKSMGVIATFTNELFEMSQPNIEVVCREAMLGDTGIALDLAFLGNFAGSAVQPKGLQAFATGGNTAASGGNTVAAITADIRGRVAQMASKGMGRKPVWVMNTMRRIGLELATTAAGTPAFPSVAANGTLVGYPIIESITVDPAIVYLVDAAEVAFAGGTPTFLGTEVATLHEEDTTPLPIGSTGAPAVVAAPVRSLYQTNSSALRAVWKVDWTVGRGDGAVQTLTAVGW